MSRSNVLHLTLALLLSPFVATCSPDDSPTEPTSGALFLIRVCVGAEHAPDGEYFQVLIHDPEVIAEAEALIGAGSVKIVSGPLLEGDGGFNRPWSWHIDPYRVTFADGSIELCDGCPSFIENDLRYWIDNVGSYCPWSTEVVSRQDQARLD